MRRLLPLLAAGLVLLPAAPASAAGAERAGWWNRASAGTLALPAPTTTAGDLRVVSGADAPSAFAALLLSAPGSRAARLELTVRPGSALGTPEVVACPTAADDWPAGDNQPFDAAPAYDCVVGLAFGSLSADGGTLTFDLDDSTQVSDGTWSLALVPSPESTTPFAVDLQPPGDGTFVPAAPEAAAPEGPSSEPAPASPPTEPLLPAVDTAPFDPAPFQTADAPLLAGDAPLAAAPPVEVVPPVAAPPVPQLAGTAPRTVLARPVAQDLPGGERERLLALLLLVGLSTAVGYAAGRDRPGPRLLGGRAGAAAPVAPTPPPPRERGIGRFARARDTPPRRLR